MADKNEVREFLTDQGIVKVVRLKCRAIGGITWDSIYMQLQVDLPGGKHVKVWASKDDLDLAARIRDTLIYAETELPFVVEEPKKDQLFPSETSVVVRGVHNAIDAAVVPTYRSREDAIAAA
jgi:hypothetical protein